MYKLHFDKHKIPPTEWKSQEKNCITFLKEYDTKDEEVIQQDEYTDFGNINRDFMRYKRFRKQIHRLYTQK